jgi:hypothetical protein
MMDEVGHRRLVHLEGDEAEVEEDFVVGTDGRTEADHHTLLNNPWIRKGI